MLPANDGVAERVKLCEEHYGDLRPSAAVRAG